MAREEGDDFSVSVTRSVAEGETAVGVGTCSWQRKDSGGPK